MAPVMTLDEAGTTVDAAQTGFVGVLATLNQETPFDALGKESQRFLSGSIPSTTIVAPPASLAGSSEARAVRAFLRRFDSGCYAATQFSTAVFIPKAESFLLPAKQDFRLPVSWSQGLAERVPFTTRVATRESKAFTAFKDLVRWLRATDQEIAQMIGIGRTTVYTWGREGREPRAPTARRLFQARSMVSALVQRLGEEGAYDWLAHQDPARREALLKGELDRLQSDIYALVFRQSRRRDRPGVALPEGRLEPDTSD